MNSSEGCLQAADNDAEILDRGGNSNAPANLQRVHYDSLMKLFNMAFTPHSGYRAVLWQNGAIRTLIKSISLCFWETEQLILTEVYSGLLS